MSLQPQPVAVHDSYDRRQPAAALKPTPMWDVLLNPKAWQILIEPAGPGNPEPRAWWAPEVLIVRHVAGRGFGSRRVRGPDGKRKSIPDVGAYIANMEREGMIHVPRDYPVHAHGQDWATFVQAYPARGGGLHHCWAYEQPRIGAPVKVDQRARCEMYAGWALDLLGSATPPAHVVEAHRARHLRRLDSERSRTRGSAASSASIRAVELRMRAMGWLEHEDGSIRPNIGKLDRDSAGLGSIPMELRQRFAALTPAERAALLGGDGFAHPVAPAAQSVPLDLPDTDDEDGDDLGGETSL